MLGRRELRNAVSQVEHVAATRVGRTIAVQRTHDLLAYLRGRGEQRHRVEVALQHTGGAHALAGLGQIHRPVDAHGVGATARQGVQPGSTALGEQDGRHTFGMLVAVFVRFHPVRGEIAQNAPHVGQRELLVHAVGQHATPGIENHDGLGTGFDLCVEVGGHRTGVDLQQPVQQVRALVHHGLDGVKIGAAPTFHHVAGQRPGAAGKADQWHAAIQCLADRAHGVHHVPQLIGRIGHEQRLHIVFGTDGFLETRTFPLLEAQPQSHGIRNGQDVGKQDGGVQREALERLQRDLAGQLGRLAQRHETARAGTGGVVFGQVAPSLPHQPHRCVIGGLTAQGPQEGVVLECQNQRDR